MSVTARYAIDAHQVEGMDLTLSVTMKVSEWRQLYQRVVASAAHYETRHLVAAVEQALRHVEETAGRGFRYPQE